MKIPQFKVVPGKYTTIKFYDDEILSLIKALRYYQGDHPKNSWTKDMIAYLEKLEFTEVELD